MGHKLVCCFGLGTSLDFRVLSLDWVGEESETKLLAPWTLFPRFLSVILFLSLFRASGENTGSFARSASSLTKTTKSWKDTLFCLSSSKRHARASRHHLEPDLSGNLELISCNILYCISGLHSSFAANKKIGEILNTRTISFRYLSATSQSELVSFGHSKRISKPLSQEFASFFVTFVGVPSHETFNGPCRKYTCTKNTTYPSESPPSYLSIIASKAAMNAG